ncbi:putative restriction endonuclease [Pseudomonas phage vB_PsyM_KIL3b]|uniref:Putative restriction endonuclease n=3 Tax=Pseudomonas phage vB_PsyM_KIL1 TaxID=1777065 RepID=A0A142IG23_9CAUD|nr:HNH endonuclease [Pseudomonas phage vB_PsyM_KIL1]AMR57359.1 putative restriction endonuclease [Pseudomonas phage vB_PsyM_KIL1]AMR57680.1 putative restriction endonuclease [Pseudomonas phage vB_PsyM_KIL3]AMR58178.1 putative restriction endonuclease [Pseudomonas phage vB_PsyM_KIL3b]
MSRSKPKLVQGVGTNDADYVVQPMVNGKQVVCPFYNRWYAMIKRCYSEKELKKHPEYRDKYVCSEWLLFSNFKAWMETQDWKGKHLDKDLLVQGNKVYSPETCVFVPAWLNSLLTDSEAKRGDLPLGVSRKSLDSKMVNPHSVPYLSHVNGCTPRYRGAFKTSSEAHKAWQVGKAVAIEAAVTKILEEVPNSIDIVNSLMARVALLKFEADNNIQTQEL